MFILILSIYKVLQFSITETKIHLVILQLWVNMEHWASQELEEIEETIDSTGWDLERPQTEEGPLSFKHQDGTEVSFHHGQTGNFTVEYRLYGAFNKRLADEGVKKGVQDEKVSYGELGNATEWLIHVLKRHEKVN